MPAPSSADKRHLEMHGNSWRVTINVPKDLQGKLGTKLKRSLGTDSLRQANLLKWDVVAEFKKQIEQERLPREARDDLLGEARHYALLLSKAAGNQDERQAILSEIAEKAEELADHPIGVDGGVAVYDREDEEAALTFLSIAKGDRTPIELYHKQYLGTLTVKPQTLADDERAMRYLLQWCQQNGVPAFLSTFGRREAIRFTDDIKSVVGELAPRTLNKYLRRLGIYWKWLLSRDEVQINVWEGRSIPVRSVVPGADERPFSKDEMIRLLSGPASQHMHDLMRIAALTGCRIDPIVCLKVGDCANGNFIFKPQKKEKAERLCPIHPDLFDIVTRRSANKKPNDDLFPEWPPYKTGNKPRSNKASNQFTLYRRSVGVVDELDGVRRSLVNFHSFRRWFITEAERADQPPHIIAAVVGHKREGMTLGKYSGGPAIEQARRCVEAVILPQA